MAQPGPVAATSKDQSPRLREGDAMPFFNLTGLDGKQITLETFSIVLSFSPLSSRVVRCQISARSSRTTRAFSVYRQNKGGTISHGLATALIDKSGSVTKIWRGNNWSPKEVIAAIYKMTDSQRPVLQTALEMSH